MRTSSKAASTVTGDRRAPGAVIDLIGAIKGLFDDYRPERHYMRGPGPRWYEKHARPTRTETPPEANQWRLVRVDA